MNDYKIRYTDNCGDEYRGAIYISAENVEKAIEKAKEKLSVTNLSVSEIAYELGFEHPQSFSKLFNIRDKI